MLCGAVNALPTIANTPETARDTSKTPARENFDVCPSPAPLTSERVRHALRTSANIPVRKARRKNRNGSANYPPQAPKTRQKSRAQAVPTLRNTWVLILRPFCVFITTYAEYFTKNKKSDCKAAKHRFGSRLHRGIRRAARLSALLALLPADKLKFLSFL